MANGLITRTAATRRLWPWLVTAGLLTAVGAPVAMVLIQGFDVSGYGSISGSGSGFQFGLDYWRNVWHTPGIARALWNTATIVTIRVGIGLIAGIGLAWLLARTNMPGRRILEFGLWVSFFMPSLAVMQGWLFLAGGQSGLLNVWLEKLPFISGPVVNVYSYWGIIWVHLMGVNLSLTVILLIPVFRQMDSSLEEAAYVSGASKLRMVRSIFLPLMRPSVVFLLVLGLIKAMQSYEVERVLGGPDGIDVYATILVRMVTSEPRLLGQASALSSVILMVLVPLIILQRLTTRRQYTTISSKMRNSVTDLGRWRFVACALVTTIVLLMTAVPLVSTIAGSLMTRWGYFNAPHPWTTQHWKDALSDPDVITAIGTTLKFGIMAGFVGALVMYLVAYIVVRRAFHGNGVLDFASWLPWALPGVLLSLGVSAAILKIPVLRILNGSSAIVVAALVIYAFPPGTQLLKSALRQVHRELEEAGSTSGARWLQVQRRIMAPLLMPMLIAAGLITFVAALSEVSGIILLAPTSTRTLALVSLDYMAQSRFETAGVLNALLLMMAVAIALIARIFGIRLGAGGEQT